ncbi:MAG: hypothetical protein AAF127_05295 [Pseudomonadota bacterium]
MAVTVELITRLGCSADEAWEHVQKSALLHHIAAPLIRFRPQDQPFPERWTPGEYRANMRFAGVLPAGWQAVVISFPEPRGDTRFVRDNGYGPLIKRWDHWIVIEPHGESATRYTDRVHIEAGVLTPFVAAFARSFYGHRQERWRDLVRTQFAALRR